jgi:hypothetical protein
MPIGQVQVEAFGTGGAVPEEDSALLQKAFAAHHTVLHGARLEPPSVDLIARAPGLGNPQLYAHRGDN